MRNHHQSCSTVLLQAALSRSPPFYPSSRATPANSHLLSFSETIKEREGSVLHSLLRVSDLFARGRSGFREVSSPVWVCFQFPSPALPPFSPARSVRVCHAQGSARFFPCTKKMSLSQAGIWYLAGEFSCTSPRGSPHKNQMRDRS